MITPSSTHAGYFSVDKKGKMIDSKLAKKETSSDDIDAYDLIMKNKELLLDRNPKKSPVRFIFSHSALREGWDNPNVFQICTLKQSTADVRKRQEVGRGLRLRIRVGNDLEGETGYYLVEIEYSATNSFGGRNESATLQTINEKFENPLFSIAAALGTYDSFLNNTIYALDFFSLVDAVKVVVLVCN